MLKWGWVKKRAAPWHLQVSLWKMVLGGFGVSKVSPHCKKCIRNLDMGCGEALAACHTHRVNCGGVIISGLWVCQWVTLTCLDGEPVKVCGGIIKTSDVCNQWVEVPHLFPSHSTSVVFFGIELWLCILYKAKSDAHVAWMSSLFIYLFILPM